MEASASAVSPLKISFVFQQPQWSARQRQDFMETFSGEMEQRAVQLWSGTMRRLPRSMAYRLEDEGFDAPLFRLSYAPGFEGADLRVSAVLSVPPTILDYHRTATAQGIFLARQKLANSWTARFIDPLIDWITGRPDSRAKNSAFLEEAIKQSKPLMQEVERRDSAAYWSAFASSPLIESLLFSARASLERVHVPGQALAPIRVEANGRKMDFAADQLLSSSPPPATPSAFQA